MVMNWRKSISWPGISAKSNLVQKLALIIRISAHAKLRVGLHELVFGFLEVGDGMKIEMNWAKGDSLDADTGVLPG